MVRRGVSRPIPVTLPGFRGSPGPSARRRTPPPCARTRRRCAEHLLRTTADASPRVGLGTRLVRGSAGTWAWGGADGRDGRSDTRSRPTLPPVPSRSGRATPPLTHDLGADGRRARRRRAGEADAGTSPSGSGKRVPTRAGGSRAWSTPAGADNSGRTVVTGGGSPHLRPGGPRNRPPGGSGRARATCATACRRPHGQPARPAR